METQIDSQPSETAPEVEQQAKKTSKVWIWLLILAAVLAIVCTQITFYSIQPIGALPEGVTLVIPRGTGTQLFDSPDALCERQMGQVNLLCRAAAIGAIQKTNIIARLPYVETFYLWSTNGATYSK